jgi:HK97 family phage prohead protease
VIERRAGRLSELRADAAGRKLIGYAATFGTPAKIANRFTETIRAGAFRSTLDKREDVLALVDHDAGKLLGRTRAGTLRLAEDAKGLSFEVDLPATTLGNDVLALAERGDLGGMSFGFEVLDDVWPNPSTRELRSVHLVEVSVIHAIPAYPATSVAARGVRFPRSAFSEQAARFPPLALSAQARRRLLAAL